MKKRLFTLFLALAALAGLLFASAADDGFVHLAINDTMPDFAMNLMPINSGGTIYVPYTLFDQRNTNGVSLGVSYGRDSAKGTLSLYGWKGTLVFDLNSATAYDQQSGELKSFRAITQNGRIYVPAYAVCQFFGLEYAYLPTDYGPLVRIKSEKVYLDDMVFINLAANPMQENLKAFQRSQSGAPTPTGAATPAPTPAGQENVRVYLAIRVESGLRIDEMLDALDAQRISALFFFLPRDLAVYDDVIRRMVGTGHQVGLRVSADVPSAMEEELLAGNRLFETIARIQTRTVFVDGSDAARNELTGRGWVCWLSNVDGRTRGRAAATLTGEIMSGVARKVSYAKIIMDDTGTAPSALPGLLRQLKERDYSFRLAVETQI